MKYFHIMFIVMVVCISSCGFSKNKGEPELTEEKLHEIIDARIVRYAENERLRIIAEKFKPYSNAEEYTAGGKHIYGSKDARFTLVEYSDIECPFCKRFQAIPKEVVDSSKGLINWEFIHFPLPMHNPVAFIEAQSTECVASLNGNRAFWVYLDELFLKSKGNGQSLTDIAQIAKGVGVDEKKFLDCVRTGKFKEIVQSAIDRGNDLGITGTPTTFIVDNLSGKIVPMASEEVTVDSIAIAIGAVLGRKF